MGFLRELFRSLRKRRALDRWRLVGFTTPAPHFVKQAVLARHSPSNATWVETGTFNGDTTAFLAKRAAKVFSIEPEPTLYAKAAERLKGLATVTVLNGPSESMLPQIVAGLGGNVAFWLDGHYSEGNTFKGETDTPIVFELDTIGKAIHAWGNTAVLVDDVRCFGANGYPRKRMLIDWAEAHGLEWSIEHDIFVARNF